jgi:hypothetical protein
MTTTTPCITSCPECAFPLGPVVSEAGLSAVEAELKDVLDENAALQADVQSMCQALQEAEALFTPAQLKKWHANLQ